MTLNLPEFTEGIFPQTWITGLDKHVNKTEDNQIAL